MQTIIVNGLRRDTQSAQLDHCRFILIAEVISWTDSSATVECLVERRMNIIVD